MLLFGSSIMLWCLFSRQLGPVFLCPQYKPWFAPITWLLPDEAVSQVHMKIGVNGSLESGKVRLTLLCAATACICYQAQAFTAPSMYKCARI